MPSHCVARARPVLCMLNEQLKSFATTSPGPLIRVSPDFCSLYSRSAGGPIVSGVLEDCNLGSFISAVSWGGLGFKASPITFMASSIVAEVGCRLEAAGAVRCGIASFLARQDWWASSLPVNPLLKSLSHLQTCHREVSARSHRRNSSLGVLIDSVTVHWPLGYNRRVGAMLWRAVFMWMPFFLHF